MRIIVVALFSIVASFVFVGGTVAVHAAGAPSAFVCADRYFEESTPWWMTEENSVPMERNPLWVGLDIVVAGQVPGTDWAIVSAHRFADMQDSASLNLLTFRDAREESGNGRLVFIVKEEALKRYDFLLSVFPRVEPTSRVKILSAEKSAMRECWRVGDMPSIGIYVLPGEDAARALWESSQ